MVIRYQVVSDSAPPSELREPQQGALRVPEQAVAVIFKQIQVVEWTAREWGFKGVSLD